MKAQKAAGGIAFSCVTAIAAGVCAAAWSLTQGFGQAVGAEEADAPDVAAIAVETTVADADGSFTATVSLEELPASGICALEFALAYDQAVLTINGVELLYDTGADAAEALVDPALAGTVFRCRDVGGELQIRWATALLDRDYWLSETRAFFTVSGTLRQPTEPGCSTTLAIVPASGGDGGTDSNARIVAGYLDADGTPHSCETRLTDGMIWTVLDETGATMYGDLDMNGVCTVSDAVLLHRLLAEQDPKLLCAAAYANADCESDGVLSIADAAWLLRRLDGTAMLEAQ